MLAIARELSPQLAARALDADAARARVKVAGSLPDPVLRITSDEIDLLSGPRQNKMLYSVEQEIPLWGKQTLRREAAEAEVSQKAAELKDAETELTERVKVTFALRYQTYRALQANRDLRPILASISQVSRDRYAQSLAPQQDVIRAEMESTRLLGDIARLEARRTASMAGSTRCCFDRSARRWHPRSPCVHCRRGSRLDVGRSGGACPGRQPIACGQRRGDPRSRQQCAACAPRVVPNVTLSAGAIDRTGNGPTAILLRSA